MTHQISRRRPSDDTRRMTPRPRATVREPSARAPRTPLAFRSHPISERIRKPGREALESLFGMSTRMRANAGKVRPGLLLWALGVPLPVILLIVLLRGC